MYLASYTIKVCPLIICEILHAKLINKIIHYIVMTRVHKRQECAAAYPFVVHPFLKWRSNASHVSMATILIFLHNVSMWNLWRRLCSMGMTLKRLTKRAMRDIAEAVSGEVPSTLTEEVLRRISAATFAHCVAFTETLQQHKKNSSLLLQHMIDCYKALLAGESSCVSASVAIIHLLTRWTSLRIFMHYVRISIQLPCWPVTRYCVILEKGCTMEGVGGCALLSLMYPWS